MIGAWRALKDLAGKRLNTETITGGHVVYRWRRKDNVLQMALHKARFVFQLLLGLLIAPSAHSALILNDGLEHSINYTIDNTVKVFGDGTVLKLQSGGLVTGYLETHDRSTTHILGGAVTWNATVGEFATFVLSSGTVGASLVAGHNSTVKMNGGHINGVLMGLGDSTVSVHGGHVASSYAVQQSTRMDIYGGTTQGYNLRHDSSTTVYGTNFAFDGVAASYGTYQVTGPDYFDARLTGILSNGDAINVHTEIYENATLTLAPNPVPAPGALLLGCIGLAVANQRLRKKRD